MLTVGLSGVPHADRITRVPDVMLPPAVSRQYSAFAPSDGFMLTTGKACCVACPLAHCVELTPTPPLAGQHIPAPAKSVVLPDVHAAVMAPFEGEAAVPHGKYEYAVPVKP